MTDQINSAQVKKQEYQAQAEIVIRSLQRKHVRGYYAADCQAALAQVLELIPDGKIVARGDSMSVDQVGVIEALIKRGKNQVNDVFHTRPDGTHLWTGPEDRLRMSRAAFTADIYVTGSNAITLDGKIVNVDGMGNRVAPMIYGPAKVILVIGANKIVKNEEAARQRIRDIAAPANVKRHIVQNNRTHLAVLPCVKTGKCVECENPERICRYTTIINGADRVHDGRFNVVLVGEDLGI